ncbi:MAG: hypothetical protein ACTSRW_00520 [Candidatus Helarchaeota archaeon]
MEPIELIFKLREGIDETNFQISDLKDQLSAGKLSIKEHEKKKKKLEKYIAELNARIDVIKKKFSPLQKYVLNQTDEVLEHYQAELDLTQIGILKVLFLLDQETYFIVPVDFRDPKHVKVEFPTELSDLIGSADELQALKEVPADGFQVKVILDEIQSRLNSKQDMFNEIDLLSEQFTISKTSSKTRVEVTLYGLDMQEFSLFVDVGPYPDPPVLQLTPSLQKHVSLNALRILKNWDPQRFHVYNVIQEISLILDKKLRLNREMELFEKFKIPATLDETNGIIKVVLQESPQSPQITFLIKIPPNYPHSPPLVEQVNPMSNEALNEQILTRLNQATSEYLELQNFAEVFSEILDIMKEHSEYVCVECKQFKCPTCGKNLFSSIAGVIGENNCYRRTKCCGATLHECCYRFFVGRDHKCPACGAAISRL